MALMDCPECGKPVSTSAQACPNCGYPVAEETTGQPIAAPASTVQATADPKTPLLEVRPSWWGYFWHLFFFFLIVPPIIAWVQRRATVLRIYPHRITLERGLVTKCYRDYSPQDIRSLDVDQGFFQRLAGIGNLTLSTAATVEAAEQIRSIPDPKGVRDLILAQRQ